MSTKSSPLIRICSFIVDKRNLFFLIYAILILFSLFSSGWISVENELSAYLSEETETKQAMNLMEEEYTTFGSAKVMVSNISLEEAFRVADRIQESPGVSEVTFLPEYLRPGSEEVPEEEMPKEDPFEGMDGGFFERTGPQEVNGGTGESGSAEKTEQSIEDNRNAAAGFFRMADGSFNWGCLGWILVAVLVVLAVVTLVTHVVIRFWPVILLLLSAGIITSFFNNRR